MRVERFDYPLPPELIAQAPTAEREQARLLVAPPAGALPSKPAHRSIADLAEHVAPGTLVVLNDTKVLPARILGTKEGTGGKSEVFLVTKLADAARDDAGASAAGQGENAAPERWRALARASKALRPGTRIVKDELVIEFEGKGEDGLFEVRLTTRDGSPVEQARRKAGQIPLPPYIKRDPSAEDVERYQTVFARVEGAVAAPTAGLHLTEALMQRLTSRGCEIATCTLHVGLGTFQPVTVEDLDQHPMHAEYFEVSRALAAAVARARERGAPVLAIGTTVVRALESASDPARPNLVRPCAEETRILIQPGHRFAVVDRLLTNFHLPKSTLLALVCAFAGTSRVLDVYREAVRERYRFFSYGDAMLLDREEP
jgi:S-adenosylmethionine:tRNA ribosyltransferase-isomerase